MVLLVLEGIDASGKKTQAEMLVERLNDSGKKAVLLDFPSYETPFGKLITLYLKGKFGAKEKISKKFACLLYALDRYSRKEEIEGFLKKGFVVVLDRYTQANFAYQTALLEGSERKKMVSWIETVESGLPKADAVVFLDVPPLQSQNLLSGRKNKIRGVKRDIHEKDFSFIKKVYGNYLKLSKEKKWIVVSCMEKGVLKSKGEISNLVFSSLRKRKVL